MKAFPFPPRMNSIKVPSTSINSNITQGEILLYWMKLQTGSTFWPLQSAPRCGLARGDWTPTQTQRTAQLDVTKWLLLCETHDISLQPLNVNTTFRPGNTQVKSSSAVILCISTHGTPLVQWKCLDGANCCIIFDIWSVSQMHTYIQQMIQTAWYGQKNVKLSHMDSLKTCKLFAEHPAKPPQWELSVYRLLSWTECGVFSSSGCGSKSQPAAQTAEVLRLLLFLSDYTSSETLNALNT